MDALLPFAGGWRLTLHRNCFKALLGVPDLDEEDAGLMVEDHGGVLRLGLLEYLDAVAAGCFRIGVHAAYEVGVEPDLRRRQVRRVERRVVTIADPDDLVPRRVPGPDLDPDSRHDLAAPVQELAPALLDALLDGRDSLAAAVALGHLAGLFERVLLHVDGSVGKARGLESPADVVGVEVREDHVRDVLRGVPGLLQVVHEALFAPELVASDER